MKRYAMIAAMLLAGSAAAEVPQPGSRYVSMGSSYAAGPGVGTRDPVGGACQRSSSNYAHLYAARHHLTLVDVACSGATTQNVLLHGQNGFPAQIEAVTPDTRLVSILIGGNDIEYVGNLLGLSCRDTAGINCHVASPDDVERRMAALPASLDQIVAEVRRRAPQARIVLVGYLPAIPSSGPGTCAAVPMKPEDAARMRGVAIRLAQVIGAAARRNNTAIVQSSMIGTGHDACSVGAYVAGYRPARNPSWPSPVAYHPTQQGMDAVAASLERVLGS